MEVDTGFEPVYTALQAAASPLGQSTVLGSPPNEENRTFRCDSIRADDEIRTRDPHLGKVMRYHCATSALLAFLRARRLYTEPDAIFKLSGAHVTHGPRVPERVLPVWYRESRSNAFRP